MYDGREASNIADMIMEEITGWERSRRIIHHDQPLSDEQLDKLYQSKKQLLEGRPVQYILGHCWFAGMQLKVDEHVLIPRPETGELVESVIEYYKNQPGPFDNQHRMIDIGTGSGCIAITLKKKFPDWEVWAMDKSIPALSVAKENALSNEADIIFTETDILKKGKNDQFPAFDIIVSNPPYIPVSDQDEMAKNVLEHEPHLALFVSNNDPMQFYNAIIEFSYHHLLRGGMAFFETHESYANHVATLMESNEFEEVIIKKDMQGKNRIVYGKKTGASL